MEDPRVILQQELIKVGISEINANVIALDAGSSQVSVNSEYLNNFQYSKITKKMTLDIVEKFYSGELFEDIEIED
ncbi:hypothetical protein MG290_04285 [Flavobacterium sp. CBA20B-1]|uniref:hypothetical protein n=1 Tax=unclassified Flavobacterium TaxID=196869 RepID=UPI002224FE91|nr:MULTISPECIES: hypothetical protein [unclassified Flavobacterium]WCM42909.1 hypothetical protein MG290_04285 [Flavobacterium sp. CBA20B-1]